MNERLEYLILEYLSFHEPESKTAPNWILVDTARWQRAFGFIDTAGLTLVFRERLKQQNHFHILPSSIQARLNQNLKDNLARSEMLLEEFLQINRRLSSIGARYLNLKGVLLHPRFVDRPEHRVQYDLDFLVHASDLRSTYLNLQELGYTPAHSNERRRADHLPPLIKKTGWEWKGNYFDPTIPPGIELHFQLWEPEFERIPIQLFENVWEGVWTRDFDSHEVPCLSPDHELLYLTLHCCRHLFRGDLRLSHLYEIAHFLHHNCRDQDLWNHFLTWLERCSNSAGIVATGFGLSATLFRPCLDSSLRSWIRANVPQGAANWISLFGRQDAIHGYRGNKNTVFLHLSLLKRRSDQWAVLKQKLLPATFPPPVSGIHIPEEKKGISMRLFHAVLYTTFLFRRVGFHFLSFFRLGFQLPVWIGWLRHPSEPEF